jgi:ketosteroid isomerase-like protein
MKQFILSIILMVMATTNILAQSTKKRLQLIEDKMALKELVDSFSILADQKDVDTQVLLFTEDAEVNTYHEGKLIGTFKGRENIGKAFAGYLANFTHVFHINGQQIVKVDGNHARGTAYCQVYLKGTLQGKNVEITDGAYYNDEYVKQNGRWLIAKRTTHFVWQNIKELAGKE